MSDDVSARLTLALEIARAAGALTLEFFQQDSLQVERKGDNSPVTQADRQAELLMRERIAAAFPNDGIIGEEHGEVAGTSEYQWILDPIDGTKSFIAGVPLYSVLVGVLRNGESLLGVILVPGLDECVYAAKGEGAWWTKGGASPRPAKVSVRESLADGVFVTSQVDGFGKRSATQAYERLERAAYITRTWGDGYGYLLIATGRAEAMVDPIMNIWDAAAIQPVMEEAGGTFTDWQGKPCIDGGEGIGTNGLVLQEVLKITRDFRQPS
ncbi:MAG: histidinol-phosphatase [Planctomycetota bacterium]|nr:histidinol-phosphatase [Planctomycetota bacterium]